MGKRGGWEPAARKDYDYGYDSAYWQQSGASHGWSDRQAKGYGQKGGKDTKPEKTQTAFPSYDAMSIHGGKGGKALGKPAVKQYQETEPELVGATGELARYVQKLVNTLRRSDGKLRRCETDREEAQAKWEEYQRSLKQSFLQERQRYHEKLSKVQAEQDEFLKLKDGALRELQEIVANPAQLNRPQRATEQDSAATAEWDELMAESDDPWAALPDLLVGAATGGRELQAAARQQLMGALSQARDKAGLTRTPPRKPHQPPPISPPPTERTTTAPSATEAGQGMAGTYSGGTPSAVSDLYQTSPSTSRAPMPTIRSRSRSHTGGPRVSVKTHINGPVKTGRHASLSDKLEEKRATALEEAAVVEVEGEDDEDDLIGELRGKEAVELEE